MEDDNLGVYGVEDLGSEGKNDFFEIKRSSIWAEFFILSLWDLKSAWMSFFRPAFSLPVLLTSPSLSDSYSLLSASPSLDTSFINSASLSSESDSESERIKDLTVESGGNPSLALGVRKIDLT